MRPVERIKIYLNLLKEKSKKENDFSLILTNNLYKEDLYEELEKVWLENPDWRFTQLCVNTGLIPNLPGVWYYTEDRDFMINRGFPIREILFWGTYGKNGDQPLKYIQLKNLDTDHIQAIIDTQKQLSDKKYFIEELEFRKKIISR